MDQVAEVVVVIAHQFFAVDGDGGKAVDVETLVFGNKIVKEQMVQTTSKKIVRSSEKTENACVRTAHALHVGLKVCAVHRWGVWSSHARGR